MHGEPPGERDQSVPPPARRQPGRLVGVGRGRVCRGARARRPGAAQRRVRRLPLVPRDGTRVLRGRRDRGLSQRALREHQGRPRGTSRRGRGLHGGDDRDDRPCRVADDLCARPRRQPVLRRHLLPGPAAARAAGVPPGAGGAGRCLAEPRRRRTSRDRRTARTPATQGLPPLGQPRPGGPRRGGGPDRAGLRRGERRLRRCAEVPAVDGAGVPVPARLRACPADGGRDPGGDGPRGDPRPARRRLRSLQRGCRLGGAALREDALRQRPAAAGLRRVGHEGRGLGGRGHRRLPARGAQDTRGRFRLGARRRLRGSRGHVLRVDAEAARRGARPRRRGVGSSPAVGDRRRHFRARHLHSAAA